MMVKEISFPLFDMVLCLSESMDMIDQSIVDHHKRVSYIAFSIARELGMSLEDQNNLILAGLLHDSGALSLKDRLSILQFEQDNPGRHSEIGYFLLKTFKPFAKIADFVRYHHVPWDWGRGEMSKDEHIPIESHILHLADRISVLISKRLDILGQADKICEQIKKNSGKIFVPELYRAFESIASKEYFWLDSVSPVIIPKLAVTSKLATLDLNIDSFVDLGRLICQIIDFRSHFTATHSCGVSASAEGLARLCGFSDRECQMMKIAGYLHDLGKLAVPVELLEKPSPLTRDDFNIVRCHTYYTYRTLELVKNLETINAWASFHHERLDGSGYPFHLKGKDLSIGSRIMAVADVFTAISEDRPYRKGMEQTKAIGVLEQMADSNGLDRNLVSILKANFEEVNSNRIQAQLKASGEYAEFAEFIRRD